MVKNLSVMQETRVWSLGGKYPLEKEMAAHSSILAWRIPWTEEPRHSSWGHKEWDMTEWLKKKSCINFAYHYYLLPGFPDSSFGKEFACNVGDPSSISGLGRFPAEGIGYPLQCSWASSVAPSDLKKQLLADQLAFLYKYWLCLYQDTGANLGNTVNKVPALVKLAFSTLTKSIWVSS